MAVASSPPVAVLATLSRACVATRAAAGAAVATAAAAAPATWTDPEPVATTTRLTSAELVASLGAHPTACYTTARTAGPASCAVFQLRRHVDRLGASASALFGADPAQVAADSLRAMSAALRSPLARASDAARKLTVVVEPHEVRVLVEPLRPRDARAPVRVALGGPPRHDPKTKDLAYVAERRAFVDPAMEETLLVDRAAGRVLEGSQTNFFAVMRGAVWTARDGVLEGTVRALVLDACAALRVPLRLEAPLVADLPRWEEAFIASTSRLVLSVDELEGRAMHPHRPVTSALAVWVQQHVGERSEEPERVLGSL